ncbi:hypothetical protein SNE40_007746 [Patella caerulea]|uniref:NudC domain-containing protein 1 n=1 Tax=Patella caerulea TaxID=87958 RepID=A0AAN8JUC7_PATCE
MASKVDLIVARDILDPNFDGYKLSLEPLPVYSTQLNTGVDFAKLNEKQFSYLHSKLYGGYNHLIADPWHPDTVYFVDTDWSVRRVTVKSEVKIDNGSVVYSIPDSANQRLVPGRFNVSIVFPSSHLAVLSDGTGNLTLLSTDDRDSNTTWQLLYRKEVLGSETYFHISDSVYHTDNETHHIECLLIHIDDISEDEDKYKTQFTPVINWISLSSVDQKVWILERSRCIEDASPQTKIKDISGRLFDYAVLEKSGKAVLLACDKLMKLTSDSVKPVITSTDDDYEMVGATSKEPRYTWSETEEDITVLFTVPLGISKADIYLTLTHDHIEFGIKNSSMLLDGDLCCHVDVEASTWTIQGQRLELTLGKTESKTWSVIVDGDTSGEKTFDPQQIEAIHQRLEALTSDQQNPFPDREETPYNAQELEDCDVDIGMMLLRIDGETHHTTHQINLSEQWLFSARLDSNKPPSICLRHDVDGLLWQPDDNVTAGKAPWKHIVSFNALGYVQASKQQKKYSSCSPNCLFSVICDCSKHIYVYHRHSPINSPLRNRKTGKQVNTIAKQQVVSLDTADPILGLHTTNDKVFVITETSLYLVRIRNEI